MAVSKIKGDAGDTISISVDDTLFSSSTANSIIAFRRNNVVHVQFWGCTPIFTGVKYSVVTGLPKAALNATAGVYKGGTASNVSLGNAYINGGQTTISMNITSANTQIYGSLIYVAND